MRAMKINSKAILYIILGLLLLALSSIPSSRFSALTLVEPVQAQTDEQLCLDTDGNWIPTTGGGGFGSSFECDCPGAEIFDSSVGCVNPDQLRCEQTGGNWIPTTGGGGFGSSFQCDCQGAGEIFDRSYGCGTSDEILCDETGGNWIPTTGGGGFGSSFQCDCQGAGETFDDAIGCRVSGAGAGDDDDGSGGPTDGNPIEEVDSAPTCPDGTPGVAVSFETDPPGMDGPNDTVPGCIEFNEDDPNLENNPIFDILGNVIQFLLASIGIGLTAVIVIAGFQYIIARGDPQMTASARKKIGFAITGVILYAFAATILNFLVPGGII